MKIELNDPRPEWLTDDSGDVWWLEPSTGKYVYRARPGQEDRRLLLLSYATIEARYGIAAEGFWS